MGIAVFAGYYVPNNVSSGKPLHLRPPGPHYCSIAGSFDGYYYKPSSDSAVLAPNYTHSIRTHASITMNGSWKAGSAPNYTPRFELFSPGAYTVVEGDEWGDLLFLYFDIR